MRRTAIVTPTAIPAFAPDESPEEGVEVSELNGGSESMLLGSVGVLSSVVWELLAVVDVVRVRIRVDILVGGFGVQLSTEKERKWAPIEVH